MGGDEQPMPMNVPCSMAVCAFTNAVGSYTITPGYVAIVALTLPTPNADPFSSATTPPPFRPPIS